MSRPCIEYACYWLEYGLEDACCTGEGTVAVAHGSGADGWPCPALAGGLPPGRSIPERRGQARLRRVGRRSRTTPPHRAAPTINQFSMPCGGMASTAKYQSRYQSGRGSTAMMLGSGGLPSSGGPITRTNNLYPDRKSTRLNSSHLGIS